jgi:hypothetical protein
VGARLTAKQATACRTRTYNYAASSRLIPSCEVHYGLRQPLSLYYRSRLSNPSKDCLTPYNTTIRRLFLALSRLCQVLPALYRCEPHNLPPQSIMQILVAGHLYKCILFLSGWVERLRQISHLLCSQRVEGTSSGERARRTAPQAPGKSQIIVVQESL